MSALTVKQDKRHSIAVIVAGIIQATARKPGMNLESDDNFYRSTVYHALDMYDMIDRHNRRAEAIFVLGEKLLNAVKSGEPHWGVDYYFDQATNGLSEALSDAIVADKKAAP